MTPQVKYSIINISVSSCSIDGLKSKLIELFIKQQLMHIHPFTKVLLLYKQFET